MSDARATTAGPEASPAAASALLRVEELRTGYGDLTAVWDATVSVRPGEITTLLGRNGAGKTTTLRAIAGLNQVASGRVIYDDGEITHRAAHRRVADGIAFVQEGKRVFRQRTVEENLLIGGFSRSRRKRGLAERIEAAYDLFPILGEKRSIRAGALSGGQQQMLAIGQALMSSPRLLMLDEPSGGLAPVIVQEVMERVVELKRIGLAVLLVEQAVDLAIGVADRVVVMDGGRTVAELTAQEAAGSEALHAAFFGDDGASPVVSDSPTGGER